MFLRQDSSRLISSSRRSILVSHEGPLDSGRCYAPMTKEFAGETEPGLTSAAFMADSPPRMKIQPAIIVIGGIIVGTVTATISALAFFDARYCNEGADPECIPPSPDERWGIVLGRVADGDCLHPPVDEPTRDWHLVLIPDDTASIEGGYPKHSNNANNALYYFRINATENRAMNCWNISSVNWTNKCIDTPSTPACNTLPIKMTVRYMMIHRSLVYESVTSE